MIKRAFTEHPSSVGESYFQHMGMAFGFGVKMVVSGIACLIHGLLPFLFVHTGKDCIQDLHYRMVTHRDRRLCVDEGASLTSSPRDKDVLRAAE